MAFAAGGDNELVAEDQRRGRIAVERRRRVVFAEVASPDLGAGLQVEGYQLANRTERIHRPICHGRRPERSVVGAVVSCVLGTELVAPDLLAVGQVEGRDHIDLARGVHRHPQIAFDPDVGVARAQVASPRHREAEVTLGEGLHFPVCRWTAELGRFYNLRGKGRRGRRKCETEGHGENRNEISRRRATVGKIHWGLLLWIRKGKRFLFCTATGW